MASRRQSKGRADTDAPPREIELKLEIDPEGIERLLAHPLLTEARPAEGQGGALRAIYYDTPDEALRRAGISLRTRHNAGGWVQTIKADSGAKGLALDRHEWETPVAGEALDLAAAEGTALEPLLAKAKVRTGLAPAFTVASERSAFLIEQDGAEIELVLDRADVSANGASRRFGEIELELKRGEPGALFHLARALADIVPARLSFTTKSARGYALLSPAPLKAVKAEPVAFAPDATSAEAFQAIARSCLSQAIRNEAVLRQTRNPDALHQFRVGLRRLRAAISLFKDLFDDPESEAIRGELRGISQKLGAVRDLDVFIDRLQSTGESDALAKAEARRAEAYDEMLARLERRRFRRTILTTAVWIEAGDWLVDPKRRARKAGRQAIQERAEEELSRRWKRVLKRARHLQTLDPEARHRVRIEIKKLRYGAEFFHGLFPGRTKKAQRKEALAGLENLQEILGELNDIAVGGLMAAGPEDMGGDPAAHTDELLARAGQNYERLAALKPFWE